MIRINTFENVHLEFEICLYYYLVNNEEYFMFVTIKENQVK